MSCQNRFHQIFAKTKINTILQAFQDTSFCLGESKGVLITEASLHAYLDCLLVVLRVLLVVGELQPIHPRLLVQVQEHLGDCVGREGGDGVMV